MRSQNFSRNFSWSQPLRGKKCRRFRFAIALSAFTCAQLGFFLASSHIPAAHAQALTDEDINNYARAVLEIEALRIATYESASDILITADSELSILDVSLSCARTNLRDMPDIPRPDRLDLQEVLVRFCNEASSAAEANDLTPKRFNDITAAHRADEEVADRIRAVINQL